MNDFLLAAATTLQAATQRAAQATLRGLQVARERELVPRAAAAVSRGLDRAEMTLAAALNPEAAQGSPTDQTDRRNF